MAHFINTTVLLDGSKRTIVHFYFRSDGISSDLENSVLVDPLDFGLTSTACLTVEELTYDFAGFDAVISFDSGLVENNQIWVLPEGSRGSKDFRPEGGFKDRSGPDGTGKLLISTTGLTSVGDHGSLVLHIKKS